MTSKPLLLILLRQIYATESQGLKAYTIFNSTIILSQTFDKCLCDMCVQPRIQYTIFWGDKSIEYGISKKTHIYYNKSDVNCVP